MKTRKTSNNESRKAFDGLKLFRGMVVLSALISLLSCKPIKTLINKEFPPLSTTDQQYVSVERNLRVIKTFDAHVGVHVDKELITQYLPTEIKNAAKDASTEDLLIKEVEPRLSFDEQGVFIDVDFLLYIPKYKADIKGSFKGVTAISTENDSLYLSCAFNSVKVTNLKFEEKPKIVGKALAKLITPLLKNFIVNVNGEFLKKPVKIYAGWGEVYKFRLKEMIKDPNMEISIDSLVVSRVIKKSSIRVNSNGVSVMVELAENRPARDSIEQTAFKNRTNSELTRIFKIYDKKFDSLWIQSFEAIDQKAYMTVNVSKAEISNILNTALSKPFNIRQKFEIPKSTFNEKLEVKRGDIDCQKVRTDFSYPDFDGDGCDWDCMIRILGRRVEDPVCAASRRACRVRREAERIIWQGKRETARIAHQVENEAKVAACNVWRETMDFLALGRFKGDISGSGKASVNFSSLQFNSDLTQLNFRYNGSIDAKLTSNLELNPVDLGYVFFCYTNYDKKISSDIEVRIPDAASQIRIDSERENENVILKVRLNKISYNATISPSPLHVLLTDPVFAAKCPINTLLGIGSGAAAVSKLLGLIKLAPEQELLLMGDAKGTYDLKEMQFAFKPVLFKINGEEKKSLLFWNAKSIQATYPKTSGAEVPDNQLIHSQRN